MSAAEPTPLTLGPANDPIDAWVTAHGDRVVVRLGHGTVCCDPLVGQLLDGVAPAGLDPAGAPRPSRHYLLDVDGHDHIVIIAAKIDTDGEETPIALARCVRLEGSATAIPSLVVAAEMRGRGIGTRLLGLLCAVARARGVHRFHFDLDVARGGGPGLGLLGMLRGVAGCPITACRGLPSVVEVPLVGSESSTAARSPCATA